MAEIEVPIGTRELGFIHQAAEAAWRAPTDQAARQLLTELWRVAYLDGRKDEHLYQLQRSGHNPIEIKQAVSQQVRGCAYHGMDVTGCYACDRLAGRAGEASLTLPRDEFELARAVYTAVMHCPAGIKIVGFVLEPEQRFLHEDTSVCEHTGTATVRMT